MADTEDPETEEAPEQAEGRAEPCMPCRGTGSVVSNKGGTEATVECPWCKGTGTRIPGHDAQAHWGAVEGPAPDPSDGPELPDSAA